MRYILTDRDDSDFKQVYKNKDDLINQLLAWLMMDVEVKE